MQTPDQSPLSVAMSNWYEGGIRRLYVHHADQALRVAAQSVFSALFCTDGTPRPELFDNVPFKKLFGRRMPVGEDDDTLRSGRVLVDPANLTRHVPALDELKRLVLQSLTSVLARHMTIDNIGVVTEQLIIRGAGRIEAQQTHFDGLLSKAGATTTVSVIVALSPQNATLFHSYLEVDNFPASVFFAPRVFPGDYTGFDPDKVSHEGYLSGTVDDGILSVPAMFYMIYVNQSTDEVVSLYEQASEVTNYPHTILSKLLLTPIISCCKTCSRELVPSMGIQYMICSGCAEVERLPVLCEVCSRLRPVAVPCTLWTSAIVQHGPKSIVGYLGRSVLAAEPESEHVTISNATFSCRSRFCSHHSNAWIAFPTYRTVELVFKMNELRLAATWLLSLHHANILVSDKVRLEQYANENGLFDLLGVVIQSEHIVCPRQLATLLIVLDAVGVEHATSLEGAEGNGLLIRDCGTVAFTAVARRVRVLRRLICTPSAQDIAALSKAWFRRDKRTRFWCIDHPNTECLWGRVPSFTDNADDESRRRWKLMMSISSSRDEDHPNL